MKIKRKIIKRKKVHFFGAGKKGAKEALDSAVQRGNEQLERFEKANKS